MDRSEESLMCAAADPDQFPTNLRITPVSKRIGEATVRMLAYNGPIPGSTLRVPQGSEVVVNDGTRETQARSTSPTPACGWRTATSPSTTRAA